MTDQTQPEGGLEAASQELPIPKLESPSNGSATSSVDTKALAQEVANILKPEFERMTQSTKDKRIAQIQKQLGMKDLAELEELGVQIPENTKLEYRLRQLENTRQPEGSATQTPTSQGSGATLTAQDVSEAVSKYQLNANETEVIEALRGTYRDRNHFELTLAQMALAKANKPTPSPAASTALQGSPPASSGGPDTPALITELNELQKFPTKNKERISHLYAELDKRGWK